MAHVHINQGHPRFAELDGLRALALVSVVLFHCNISGLLNGGFLGVDVFFTISGFIITALLVREYRDNGDFQFFAFYFRRLKRLLPPVFVLVSLAALTIFISESAFGVFRADTPAALAYVSNWWQIAEKQSYFDTTPHVLKHLWSLALEEQFYFIWPPVAYLSLKKIGTRGTGVLALVLAIASTAWMAWLFDAGLDSAGQNRLYLGTDTHAMGLLTGAALACFWNPWRRHAASGEVRQRWRIAAGLSLAGLGYLMLALDPTHPALYRGSFLLVPVLTGVVAYCTMSDRRFLLSRLLRADIVQWLGSRSYSLYLVHWLLFVWMELLGFGDFTDALVLASALTIVVVLSELMYRCVEVPSKHFNANGLDNRHMAGCVVGYTAAASVIFVMTMMVTERATPALVSAPVSLLAPADLAPPRQAQSGGAQTQVAPTGEVTDAERIIAGGEDVVAIGDSVLLGAKSHLSKAIPGISIDADIGRQASQGLKVVRQWRSRSRQASTVLLHLGTNGYINEAQFRDLLRELADRKAVIVINVFANRRWTTPNNELIGRLASEFPNVRVVDWCTAATDRPEYFVKDGIHLTSKGMRAMTAQIQTAIGGAGGAAVAARDPDAMPTVASKAGAPRQLISAAAGARVPVD